MPFLARSMRQCLLALALLVHSAAALPVALSTHRDAVAAKPSYEDAVAAELIAPDEVTVCLAAGEEGLSVRPMDGGDPEGYEADVARLVARDLSTRLGMERPDAQVCLSDTGGALGVIWSRGSATSWPNS